MTFTELTDRLTSALHPILTDAENSAGWLVGGTINLCKRDPAGGGYARVARLTIARKGTECVEVVVTHHNADGNGYVAKSFLAGAMEEMERWTGSTCPTCESPRVVRRGGCEVCLSCGNNVGGCG